MTGTTEPGALQNSLYIKPLPSVYTPAQVSAYQAAIGYTPDPAEDALAALKRVVRGHLCAFAFENSAMYYTKEHEMDVSPEGVFTRLVAERKGGSYCFGHNGLILGMLRGMGFRAYPFAGRINAAPAGAPPFHLSASHMGVFVQPFPGSTRTYIVDVGFGVPGLTRPILLKEGEEVVGATPTERHKLTRGALRSSSVAVSADPNAAPGHVLWNLEVQHVKKVGEDAPWKIMYSFSEEEMLYPRDAEDASFVVAQKPERMGLFCNHVVCVKHEVLTDTSDSASEGQGGEKETYMARTVMFHRDVKRYAGHGAEVLRTLASEQDRIQALREVFGVVLEEGAEKYMSGMKPEIREGNEPPYIPYV